MVKIDKETENDFYIYFSDKTTAKFPYFTLISYMIQSVAPRKVVHLSSEILKINTTGEKKINQIELSDLFSQDNLLKKNTVGTQICFCYCKDSAILVCCNHINSSINKHNYSKSYSRRAITNTWMVEQR